MSKKKLNTVSFMSELRGNSAFFKSAERTQSPTPPSNLEDERTDIRTEKRTEIRSVQFPAKRLTRRYNFEFYDDQVTRIKAIKHDLEMAGERVSMSDIVREALDEYLSEIEDRRRTDIRSDKRTNEDANG